MKKWLTVVLSLFICLGIFSTNATAKEKVYEWKFVLDWPEIEPTVQKLAPQFAEWVKKESNGRMIIKIYSGGTLVPPVQSFDSLKAGSFQLLHTAGAYHGGKLPVANPACMIPMGPRDADDYWKLHFNYGMKELLSDAYKEHKIKYLAPTPWSGLNVISKKPIRKLEDFKGLKIRTAGLQAALWKEVGASTVFVPSGELYLSLQQGVVDAAAWSTVGIDAMKLGEVTNYMLCSPPMPPGSAICAGSGTLLANEKAYNKLPPDLQRVIDDCSLRFGMFSAMIYREFDNDFLTGGDRERNMEANALPKEEMSKLRQIAMEKIWPTVARKDDRSAAYVDKVRQLLRDDGVIK